MPTHRRLEQHLDGLRQATVAFGRHATASGLDVDVPTCPGWTVRRLVGHQGAVHRWAAAALKGGTAFDDFDWSRAAKTGRSHADPVDWLRSGAISLVGALAAAPADLRAPVFLADPPPPRLFWARRQAHETTMHAVDVQAAALGRLPRPEETGIDPDLALDGVDELLTGFVPRPGSRLHAEVPVRLAVVPIDAAHSWTVDVGPEGPPVTTRHEGHADGDLVATADALTLYLALWHRTPLESAIWPLWHASAVH